MAIVINGSGTITGVSPGGLPDGSVDSDTLATGIDATKLADGSVTSTELQYINTLSSNAQTQISAAGPTDIKVSACLTSDSSNITGDGTGYNVAGTWTEITDTGADFASGTFTAPETGTYLITGCCYLTELSSSHSESFFRMNTSNRSYLLWRGKCSDTTRSHSGHFAFSYACIADMDTSDTAYLHAAIYGSTKVCDMQGSGNVNASNSMQVALLA